MNKPALLRWIVEGIKMYKSTLFMAIGTIFFPASLWAWIELKPDKSLAIAFMAIAVLAFIMAYATIKQEITDDKIEKLTSYRITVDKFDQLKSAIERMNTSIVKLLNEIRQERNERNNRAK